MIAMFASVLEFARFNCKPHLFAYGEPYQVGAPDADGAVYINLANGSEEEFASRVSQFGGVVLLDC